MSEDLKEQIDENGCRITELEVKTRDIMSQLKTIKSQFDKLECALEVLKTKMENPQ